MKGKVDGPLGGRVLSQPCLVLCAVLALCALVLAQGCGGSPRQTSLKATAAHAGQGTVAVEDTIAQAVTDSSETTETADRIAYAVSHGGKPRRGETVYLLTIASEVSESAARTRLEEALLLFGEDGSSFVVQRSENFEGLEAGKWIVVEAFSSGANADSSRPSATRVTEEPRVDRVVVRTDEPIPVYEEALVGD